MTFDDRVNKIFWKSMGLFLFWGSGVFFGSCILMIRSGIATIISIVVMLLIIVVLSLIERRKYFEEGKKE